MQQKVQQHFSFASQVAPRDWVHLCPPRSYLHPALRARNTSLFQEINNIASRDYKAHSGAVPDLVHLPHIPDHSQC